MKTAVVFLAIAAATLTALWFLMDARLENTSVDVHFHDTYVIIERPHFILYTVLIFGTMASIGGLIGTKFRNKAFIVSFIVFLAADIYIFLPFLQLL